MDAFYPHLDLPLTARPRDVVKAAARAMHPWIRRQRSLRLARRRFYRDMLSSHEAAQDQAKPWASERSAHCQEIPHPATRPIGRVVSHMETPMADYFTHFSCLLGVGSADDAAKALALYEALADQMDADTEGDIGFQLEVQPESDGVWLWIHDDVDGDTNHVIAYVQHLAQELELTGLWGFKWVRTCSRPRIDAFGGGACVIDLASGEITASITTGEWLAQHLAEGVPTNA